MEYIEITAKTVNEAITKACMQLGLPSDRLDIQVVSEGSRGFLGIGNKPAIIKVAEKKEEAKEEKKPVKKEVVNKEIKKEVKETVVEAASETSEVISDEPKERKNKNKRKDHHKKNNFKKEEFRDDRKPVREEKREPVIKTEDEIKAMSESSEKFLKEVFDAMEIPAEISMNYVEESGCLEINLSGSDMGVLIGKRGQTLDSLQYLTSLVVNKGQKEYVRVKLDTEDYRRRRKETLENLAKNIASKVKKTRKTVVLEPMNPYERRIIHSVLQSNRFVETYSEGNEPYRHVVVALKK